MRWREKAALALCLISCLLIAIACLQYAWQKEKQANAELREMLALTNKEYDLLYEDYFEMLDLIYQEPWLKLEWENKYSLYQVCGVDGKMPRER